jgi:hypothetical protein
VPRHHLHHDYTDEKREAWRLLGDHRCRVTSSP